jgi:hypothetical protein
MTDDSPTPQQPADNSVIDLSNLDPLFARAPAYDGDDLPPGRYHVRVKDAVLEQVRENEFSFKWELTVTAGPFVDWQFCKYIFITGKRLHVIKWDLLAVGLNLENLSDLPQHLPSLRSRELEVAIRNRLHTQDIHFINNAQREFERVIRI